MKFLLRRKKTTAERVPASSKVQSWKQFLGPPCSKSMVVEPVTEQKLEKIILILKNSSAGFNQVPTKVNKFILPSITKLLCHLVKKSLQLGVWNAT